MDNNVHALTKWLAREDGTQSLSSLSSLIGNWHRTCYNNFSGNGVVSGGIPLILTVVIFLINPLTVVSEFLGGI